MRYDEYLAQGLPIATGSVEGACKNLIKDRMQIGYALDRVDETKNGSILPVAGRKVTTPN
jgi:hypothetical protein